MTYRRDAGPKKFDGHVEWLRRAAETDARRPRKERRTPLFLYTKLQAQGVTGSYSRGTNAIGFDVPLLLSSTAVWSPVPHPEEIDLASEDRALKDVLSRNG